MSKFGKWGIDEFNRCPVCGDVLRFCDALNLCGWLFVWCYNSKCRWCLCFIFENNVFCSIL